MQKKILEFIRKHQMIAPKETCLVGLSGGADSVCLLYILYYLQQELDCKLQAVHINHNIRGEEALRDAEFSRKLCEELQIPYYEYSYPVEEMAKKAHLGTEEMGRILRKQAYQECMQAHGGEKLALAHHQNDLAETCLFHLARGTSLDGLASLRPVRGHVIRPLLDTSRDEIVSWLTQQKICWCEDSTNRQDDYTRNQIRHHVLPVLEAQINSQAVKHIAALSEDVLETADYLQQQTEKLRERVVRRTDQGIELHNECRTEHKILVRRLILDAIASLAAGRKDITREHVESVCRLFDMETGKQISLTKGIVARRVYEGVTLQHAACNRGEGQEFQNREADCEIHLGGFVEADTFTWRDYDIHVNVLKSEVKVNDEKIEAGNEIIPEKTYTKWFDYDKIVPNAVFRTRRNGDYLVINQSGSHKKLKDYLIDCKVPREKRDDLLLLAIGSEVLWVVGYRIGESAKISKDTKKILQIKVDGGNTNE